MFIYWCVYLDPVDWRPFPLNLTETIVSHWERFIRWGDCDSSEHRFLTMSRRTSSMVKERTLVKGLLLPPFARDCCSPSKRYSALAVKAAGSCKVYSFEVSEQEVWLLPKPQSCKHQKASRWYTDYHFVTFHPVRIPGGSQQPILLALTIASGPSASVPREPRLCALVCLVHSQST